MESFGPAEMIFLAFAGIGSALFLVAKFAGKKFPGINGDGSHHDSRVAAKLDTLIGATREHSELTRKIVDSQVDLVAEQRKTNEALVLVKSWRDGDLERHGNIKEQLNRIESDVDFIKDKD